MLTRRSSIPVLEDHGDQLKTAKRQLQGTPGNLGHQARTTVKSGSVDTTNCSQAGVAGLFGPDGPHPFGAALRALSCHVRGSTLEQRSAATNNSGRQIWLGWQDSNLRMAGSKPVDRTREISKLLILLPRRCPRIPLTPQRCLHGCHQHEVSTGAPDKVGNSYTSKMNSTLLQKLAGRFALGRTTRKHAVESSDLRQLAPVCNKVQRTHESAVGHSGRHDYSRKNAFTDPSDAPAIWVGFRVR